MFDTVLNTRLYFPILQTQVLIFQKPNSSIPAQIIVYLVITLSTVKCKESRIFKKYNENLLL